MISMSIFAASFHYLGAMDARGIMVLANNFKWELQAIILDTPYKYYGASKIMACNFCSKLPASTISTGSGPYRCICNVSLILLALKTIHIIEVGTLQTAHCLTVLSATDFPKVEANIVKK